MKTLQDIQYNIKEKEKMYIIIDYETAISILNSSYSTDLYSPIYKRIFENFAKKDFINFTILINKKEKKFKPKSIYKNTNINYIDINEFKNEEKFIEDGYESVYIGSDEEILKIFKKNKLFSIVIDPSEKVKKICTLWLSKDTYIKFLTETNNIYL